jgi:Rha family phage regulatory protein
VDKTISILNQEGQLVVTSRQVSEDFEKEHSSVVVRAIENLIKDLEGSGQNCTHLFIETQYQNEQNKQWYKEYLITRDGFSLLVMGFTGAKALSWKLKYIEAFNKMEEILKEQKYPQLSKELQAIFALDGKQQELEEKVNNLESNMPLFNIECKELQALVKSIGTKALGGYKSPAYNDNSLRGKVYSDIQRELKRQFAVNRYEAIKRSQLEVAKSIVEGYKLPLVLENQINLLNNQIAM